MSRKVAGFERGESLADIDRRPELTIHAVDPGVEPPDLGDQLPLERDRFGAKRIDLDGETSVDAIDLLIEVVDPLREFLLDTVDALIQDANVSAESVKLGRDDVLKGLLDLIVHTHGVIQSGPGYWVNVPVEIHSPRRA